ncbi:MAG: NmrA-like family protein [Subtercola sp.]|jgi:putative NADH-flavin reductase|nr:NmrA-like family protein [Subtercola sp.]
MRVAVVGASGRSGAATVARARSEGHDVISVVRTAGTAPKETMVRIADARDVAALSDAIRDADAVISCLGHARETSAVADRSVLHDGAAALLTAMAAAHVSRLVVVSAAGAYVQGDDPLSRFIAKPIVARLFGAVFPDTREMEEVIRASGVQWTILRPSRLIPGTSKPTYRFGVDRAVWWHYSTTFDTVGRASVDALTNPEWIDHAIFITE